MPGPGCSLLVLDATRGAAAIGRLLIYTSCRGDLFRIMSQLVRSPGYICYMLFRSFEFPIYGIVTMDLGAFCPRDRD